jgi:hypothetical protein
MHEVNAGAREEESLPENGPRHDSGTGGPIRLGQDVRFVLAAIGGGAIRITRGIAGKHLRHVESVAINCDSKVSAVDEFDRRVYLGPDSGREGDTGGSTVVGGTLAHAAEPALDRIFEGATFVTIVGSLGGGSGTGALPYVIEVAARHCEVLTVFVVKPFLLEGDRRAIADRALARLHFVEDFVAKQQRGLANLQVLDNEYLATREPRIAFSQVNRHWAEIIESHIEKAYLIPAETLLASAIASEEPIEISAAPAPALTATDSGLTAPSPTDPARILPALLPQAGAEAELTFEIDTGPRPPEAIQ